MQITLIILILSKDSKMQSLKRKKVRHQQINRTVDWKWSKKIQKWISKFNTLKILKKSSNLINFKQKVTFYRFK